MTKYSILFALLFAFVSCGATRRTVKQTVSVETERTATSSVTAVVTGSSEELRDMRESVRAGEIIIRYDTEKPESETTGKPPVSEERLIIYTSEKNESRRTSLESELSFISDERQASAVRASADADEAVRKKSPVAGWILICSGVAAAVVLLYRVCRRTGLFGF